MGILFSSLREHSERIGSKFITNITMTTRKSFINGISSLVSLAGITSFNSLFGAEKTNNCCLPKPSASFKFNSDGAITFFMIADWHLRMKDKPPSTVIVDKLEKKIKALNASFVVLSGDNVNTRENTIEKFPILMTPLVEALKRTNTSLAITFGNHDSEHAPNDSVYFSRQAQYDWFKKQLGDLFIDYDIPELTGVGTGVIDIYSKDTKKPSFKVYLADSGSYVRFREDGSPIPSSGWDNPHSDQIAWYIKDSADKVPHLWIQHIIVPDIITNGVFEITEETGKGIVKGRIDKKNPRKLFNVKPVATKLIAGQVRESPCPPQWSIYENKEHTVDGITLYEAWRKSGTMKGAFFGHDHSNSFDTIDNNGMRLGATAIFNWGQVRVFTVNSDGTYKTYMAKV